MVQTATRRIVLGIGNPDRGDDAAGRAVARLLRHALPEDFEVIEDDGEATKLYERLGGAAQAILIDACSSGGQAGTVHRFDVNAAPLPEARFGVTTHSFGLPSALELARVLEQLPPHCVVYAIEGQSFDRGAGLSPPVAAAIPGVVRRVLAEAGVASS
jgi:hydrogenase maturation protease